MKKVKINKVTKMGIVTLFHTTDKIVYSREDVTEDYDKVKNIIEGSTIEYISNELKVETGEIWDKASVIKEVK